MLGFMYRFMDDENKPFVDTDIYYMQKDIKLDSVSSPSGEAKDEPRG